MTDKDKISDLLPQLRQAALASRASRIKGSDSSALNNLIVQAGARLGHQMPAHTGASPHKWNAIIDHLDAIDPGWRGYMPGEGQRDAA